MTGMNPDSTLQPEMMLDELMILSRILESFSHRLEDEKSAVGLVDLDARPFNQKPSKDPIIKTHSLSRLEIANVLDKLR